MKTCMSRSAAVALAACLGLASPAPGADDEVVFVVHHAPAGYLAEAAVIVDDASAVTMHRQGEDHPVDFEDFDGEFELRTDTFATLADLTDAITGQYTMQITHSQGLSEYTFGIAAPDAAWFPARPLLEPVPATLAGQHSFAWAWDDTADAKWVEFYGDDVDDGRDYWHTDEGFDDLTADVDFGDYLGPGVFIVDYARLIDGLITDWTWVSGPELFVGEDWMIQAALASDRAEFQVVPEPGSLVLLAAGSLMLLGPGRWRRRR